jgi:ligand-binding sensor domain-containing protein
VRCAIVVGVIGVIGVILAPSPARADGVQAVHSDTREARACLPIATGGALVGTGGGLLELDAAGSVAATWTATDGLPGTRIDALVAIGGETWVGTDAGAARIEVDGTALKVAAAFPGKPVRDVARFGGKTYVATWDGGVRVAGAAKPLAFAGKKTGDAAARARASSLAVIADELYAGTAAGLFRLDSGALAAVPVEGLAAGTAITALMADGDTLWIATPAGLFARATDGGVRALGGGDLRDLALVGGEVVAAGVADGLVRVDRGRLVALAGAPRELAVAQTVAAAGDAVCAGGLGGAWLRGGPDAAWIAAARTDGPPANDISALAVDGDRLWVGTFDHGLAVYADGAWRAIDDADVDARVNAIVVEPRAKKRSRVWVATANGLSMLDGDDVTRISRRDGLPGRGVLSLALLADGRMLAGTSYGAVIVDGGRVARLGPKDATPEAVWAVAEDAAGMLWLGTTTGVYRGRETDATWARFSLATGALRDDWVTALAATDGAVLAGTYKGGVTRFAIAGDAVTATQLGDGWINPNGLAFDGDRLLASTMDGLLVGDGTTAAWTTLAGMPGKDVTAAARLGATLFVSTRRGLAELR